VLKASKYEAGFKIRYPHKGRCRLRTIREVI
jgi:hypothetical protein